MRATVNKLEGLVRVRLLESFSITAVIPFPQVQLDESSYRSLTLSLLLFATVFVAIATCVSVQLGHYPNWMLYQCLAASILFYTAHWQTYVSGTLKFGKFDVTEAQFTIIVIHMVSAIFGTQIWSLPV